jgi:hypothetical protein
MTIGTEIWKSVPGYEGILEVSNYGIVRTLDRYHAKIFVKGKILNQRNSLGYRIVNVRLPNKKRKTLKVHRLVALAFIPLIENKPDVNHIDGIKHNNTVTNLEWIDNRGNQNHALKLGLLKDGEKNKNSKLTKEQVLTIIDEQGTITSLGKKYRVAHQTISSIKRRKITWRQNICDLKIKRSGR